MRMSPKGRRGSRRPNHGFNSFWRRPGPLPLRLKPDGFGALLGAIISQQVSVASANAIRTRLAQAGIVDEATVQAAGEDGLRAVGFSRQKIRYALALAEAEIDYAALHNAPNTEVIATLTAVSGIGPWTAQIYAMFCMGRADICRRAIWPCRKRRAFCLTCRNARPKRTGSRWRRTGRRGVRLRPVRSLPTTGWQGQGRDQMTRVLNAERRAPVSGSTRSIVVFLHGYGANGADLAGAGRSVG